MKKIVLIAIASFFMFSCNEDSTKDVSKVTHYPELTLLGDEVIYLKKGDEYTDQGIIAMEGENEIPYTTIISGDFQGGNSIDTNVVDVYHVTYSAVNQDGFSGSISRTVIVYEDSDLTTSISGLYISKVVRNGAQNAQYFNMKYILVWKDANGKYRMSDGIGGYYSIGRNYGVTYAAGPVVITANDIATNNYDPIPSFGVGAFGGVATMTGLTANPANNTLSFTTVWDAGYTFVATMTKVTP